LPPAQIESPPQSQLDAPELQPCAWLQCAPPAASIRHAAPSPQTPHPETVSQRIGETHVPSHAGVSHACAHVVGLHALPAHAMAGPGVQKSLGSDPTLASQSTSCPAAGTVLRAVVSPDIPSCTGEYFAVAAS
jgi:hypothetical protein